VVSVRRRTSQSGCPYFAWSGTMATSAEQAFATCPGDPPDRAVTRRYEHEHPGELVDTDITILGRLGPGVAWT